MRELLGSGPGDANSLEKFRDAALDLRDTLLFVLSEEQERFLQEKWAREPEEKRKAAVLRDQWEFFSRFTMNCACSKERFRIDYESKEALEIALQKVLNNLSFLVSFSERSFPATKNPLAAPFLEMLAEGCKKFAAHSRTYQFELFNHDSWSGAISNGGSFVNGCEWPVNVQTPGCCLFNLLLRSGMEIFDILGKESNDNSYIEAHPLLGYIDPINDSFM